MSDMPQPIAAALDAIRAGDAEALARLLDATPGLAEAEVEHGTVAAGRSRGVGHLRLS